MLVDRHIDRRKKDRPIDSRKKDRTLGCQVFPSTHSPFLSYQPKHINRSMIVDRHIDNRKKDGALGCQVF